MDILTGSGLLLGAIGFAVGASFLNQKRLDHLDQAPLPKGLIERVKTKHPHLTPQDWRAVEAGLRQFFRLNLKAGRQMVAMPSRVVDDLWHEFILYTRPYKDFCRRGLGRFLHHTPALAVIDDESQRHALRRAWTLACEDEKIDPEQPSRLPRLFALDARLAIVGGLVYRPDGQMAGRSDGSCGGGCSGGGHSDSGDGCGGD